MPFSRDPRFDALRNAIYHTERSTFIDLVNRSLNFLVIVLGAGAVGKAATLLKAGDVWLELSVVIVATLQLVFDLGSRARRHEFLQKRYYELLAEMDDADFSNENTLAKWSANLLVIAGDEPMAMRALDSLAYNKALSATYEDEDIIRGNRIYVSWLQRRLRHIFAYHSAEFPTEDALRRRKAERPRTARIRRFICGG